MCASITNNDPIRHWHTNRLCDLKNFMERKRHRLARKPVSKRRTWTNIFCSFFLFSETHYRQSFQKIQSLQRLQSKAAPLHMSFVDKKDALSELL